MKLLTLFCAIAMVVAFALPAQAAVQNVKVGGDITIRGLYRDELDLDENDSSLNYEGESFLMSTVGVNIEADLTDNVSATVRVVNQRDVTSTAASTSDSETANFETTLDLAYITLKEMLYSPLTVIIGRQDIWIGDGFLVGANRQDPSATISANELTEITSFDAVRAILDYDPWTLNLLGAKITEGTASLNDDVDLYGLNVGYVFGQYDAEAEAYYFLKKTGSADDNEIHTVGVRGSVVPLENLDLRGEVAVQFGDYTSSRDREAMAADVSASYAWVDYAWMPTLGLGFVYLSGEEYANSGDYEAFDRLYYGKTYSAIREWQEIYYSTADGTCSAGNTNAQTIIVDGSIQPTDNILLEGRFLYFLQVEDDANNQDELGTEVDLKLTYDYTEDVSFGLLGAWFFPGDVFASGTKDDATEVIGTVSLAF